MREGIPPLPRARTFLRWCTKPASRPPPITFSTWRAFNDRTSSQLSPGPLGPGLAGVIPG
jgi:hypothetical protein